MADAAYQTIKTLNEMLEQKKVQLRAKEDHIDKLRQQMAEQRELAAE
jgi:chromosome segregation ATPase